MTKREAAKFWRDVERSAERILRQPEWMRAGITLNAANYETYTIGDFESSAGRRAVFCEVRR